MSFSVVIQVVVTAYSSPGDVSNVLNLTFTTTTVPSIAQVQDLIIRSDSFINQVSGHNWKSNQTTEQYDAIGTGQRAGTIVLRNRPLISVQEVDYWDHGLQQWVAGFNGFAEQSPNLQAYYVYQPEGKIVWQKLRLDERLRYKVTYTWGYTTPPDFIRDLSSTMTARDILTFWGSQLNIQEDITLFKRRLDEKVNRLIARATQRPATAVG